jgi:ketosteroid isomerase-like protein
VETIIGRWVADLNKGDFKSVVAACAPRAAIVDGFPPYAWQSCADWVNDYQSNNKAIQATLGILEIGKPIYEELNAGRAYVVYPATFSDTQNGKSFVYKGTMTVTLKKTKDGWVITGQGSAWGIDDQQPVDLSKGNGQN